jgi:hypothetical protein
MNREDIAASALEVAMDIFELFELVDGISEYDVVQASAMIEGYARRRVREAFGAGRGRIGFT